MPMGDKVIYVRDDDLELWEWAVAYARRRRMPVSGLVMNALQEYRERCTAKTDESDDR